MHVWTHLKKKTEGRTGIGLYPDGMVEHGEMVGELLDKLDDLRITDNNIVIYSTDNGAEIVSWSSPTISPCSTIRRDTGRSRFSLPFSSLSASRHACGSC